ncbi:MAG: histidine kinase dimerization/phospho-acceptor domain-containing protein [Dehalococcoidia bacterium]|nr:histidine kinase dimerization/phospho-acceptor domain-containing protein [Dehalococcoidia bacterium]
MPNIDLRMKLMLGVTLIMLISSIPFIVFIRSKMSIILKDELSQRGIAIAHDLAAQSVDLILTYNTYQLHELVHTVQSSNGDVNYVYIVDNKNRLLVHTFEAGFPNDLLQMASWSPGDGQRTRLLLTEYGPLLDIMVPIYGGKAGVAHLGLSYARVQDTIDNAIGWFLVTGGSGLLIAWALTYFSVGMVLRPLAKLMAAVQQVRQGNLNCRTGVNTRDEIGRFGLAFDAMVGELEQSRADNLRLAREASMLEAQAQMDKLRSEFLARASHELRTPVAAIQGYVETLMREDMRIDKDTQVVLFQDMEQISDRLSRLVHDLLNISRIDVGELKIRQNLIPLEPAIERAIRRFEMQTTGHVFWAEVPEQLPLVWADPDLLDDVLDNLLSNAVKYSEKTTSITVAVYFEDCLETSPREAPMIIVSVKDRGLGIPK